MFNYFYQLNMDSRVDFFCISNCTKNHFPSLQTEEEQDTWLMANLREQCELLETVLLYHKDYNHPPPKILSTIKIFQVCPSPSLPSHSPSLSLSPSLLAHSLFPLSPSLSLSLSLLILPSPSPLFPLSIPSLSLPPLPPPLSPFLPPSLPPSYSLSLLIPFFMPSSVVWFWTALSWACGVDSSCKGTSEPYQVTANKSCVHHYAPPPLPLSLATSVS